MPSLTPRTIDAIEPGTTDRVVFDTELPGFGLKVTPKGARVFLFQYWSAVELGKRRRVTIGKVGDSLLRPDGTVVPVTVHTARKEAERLRGLVHDRRDPFLERLAAARAGETALQAAEVRRLSERTVRDLAAAFLEDAEAHRRSAATLREYRRLFEKHLLEVNVGSEVRLGDRPIAEVNKSDVGFVRRQRYRVPGRKKGAAVLTLSISDRPILANRVQQLGRSLLNYAVRLGARPEGMVNPFAGDRWHKEYETRQPLTRDEIAALHDALADEDAGVRGGAVDAIRLLLYTGMRKQEALSLRWDAIDADTGMVTLGRTKTGPSWRPLSAEALRVLAAIPRWGTYVFASPQDPTIARVEIKRTWLRVRARAGITKPMHALRHTLASVALSEGVPLAAVGAILGHRDAATTARYAKMEGRAAKAAADKAGAALGSAATPVGTLRFTASRKRGG